MTYEDYDLKSLAPWLVALITLIGGGLRVFMIGNKGLWLDKSFSIWLGSQSVADMLQWIVKIDQHPPLYYLLLHYWIALRGDAPGSVRLLSALFGTATIPVIYLIGKRLSGIVMGLVAAVLLALSLFNIYFGQETRMYTLLTFNAAVAIYALVRLLTDSSAARPIGSQFREYVHAWRTSRQPEPDPKAEFTYQDETRYQTGWRGWIYRHRWSPIQTIETDLAWVAFIVFSAAAMLSHNTAVLFPLATNLFVLGLLLFQRIKKSESPPSFQAPSFGNWVKAQVGIFLLWSPWIVFFIKQASSVDQRFWIPEPTWEAVIQVFKTFLNPSAPIPASLAALIWTLFVLLLCLGLVHFRKNFSRFVFLAALIVIPILGELVVSLRRPIFYDRTLIWTTIPLFLLLAAGIAQLRFKLLITLALGTLVTVYLFSAGDYYRFFQKEDWSTAARYVATFAEKDDLVLFNSNFVEIPFNYYFKAYEDLYSIQVEKQGVPQDLFASGILEPEMTANDIPRLISLVSGRKRVVLVYSHASYTDPQGLIPETLASQMKLTKTGDFYGGQVQLYEAP